MLKKSCCIRMHNFREPSLKVYGAWQDGKIVVGMLQVIKMTTNGQTK